MDFRILGPLEVVGDHDTVPVGGRKEQALLALLLVNSNRVISIDRMAYELWGDDLPRTATRTLRSYLSRLRSHLGSEVSIETRGGGYSLVVDATDIDAGRFEALLESGLALRRQGSHMLAAEDLAQALEQWRGRALIGLDDHEFAQLEAARLESRRLEALEARISSDLELGRHRRVIADLEQLVALHSLHEAFWRLLMLAFYRSGRQADALRAYQQAKTRLGEELGIEPSPELKELEEHILLHDARLAPTANGDGPVHNLPSGRDHFIGREDELARIHHLLADYRCVTLTGVGGSGKTRLGLEAARRALGVHPDGVRWVELATITDADAVVEHVLLAFGEPGSHATDPTAVLIELLRSRYLLLVLDNCEHQVAPVAQLADRLLDQCPRLSILATSREALDISGEAIFHVPTLSVPAPDATLSQIRESEAVLLFADRVGSQLSGFVLDETNGPPVATICRELDGIPLAIELAAGRARSMPLPELAVRINDRLGLLTRGSRSSPPRQRTLRAAIAWSYDLLTDEAKRGFARLGVFAGPWSIEAAAAVIGDGEDMAAVADLVAELVDKSLVEQTPDDRFRLLEPVREYAQEQLVISGEAPVVGRRHRDWYSAVAHREDDRLRGVDQRDAWTRLEQDHDNLRAAIEWSLANADPDGALQLVATLGCFWMVRGYWREAGRWLARALTDSGSSPLARARAVLGASILEVIRMRFEPMRDLLEEARTSFREAGDDQGAARIELLQAISSAFTGAEDGVSALQQSYDRFLDAGDPWWSAFAARYLGAEHAESDVAVPLLEESHERFCALGDLWNAAFSMYYLSGWYLERNRLDETWETALLAVDLAEQADDVVWRAHATRNLGLAAYAERDAAAAREHMREAIDQLGSIGDDACVITLSNYLALLDINDGDVTSAVRRLAEAMRATQRLGSTINASLALLRGAPVALAAGDPRQARLLAGVGRRALDGKEQFLGLRVLNERDAIVAEVEAALDREGLEPVDAGTSVQDAVAATLAWCLARTRT